MAIHDRSVQPMDQMIPTLEEKYQKFVIAFDSSAPATPDYSHQSLN